MLVNSFQGDLIETVRENLCDSKTAKPICAALGAGSSSNCEFSSQDHPRHAPPGAAWRASCERRFAVPLMRVRQVRALSIAGQAMQEEIR